MRGLLDRQRLARLLEGKGAREMVATSQPVGDTAAPEAEQQAPPVEEHLSSTPPGAPGRFLRELGPANLAQHLTGASRILFDRLDADDVAGIEQLIMLSPELRELYARTDDPGTQRHMILAFGIWLDASVVLEKTGLKAAQPPEDIHVMARGPSAAAGGLYEADLVYDAMASIGVDIGGLDCALDFGCSSGRVVRVMAAAYPQIRWHGCDPNVPAIDWASENLAGIEFFVSGNQPPLALGEQSLDLAYAISIWSHFAPPLGLRWFEEMHRLIRPGGYLVCTTHGLTSVALYAVQSLRTPRQSDEIIGSLYRDGCWYAPEFGEEGDWGVVNPDWGTTFVSPEWMLTQLCPGWRVLEFAPGRNQDNQDVYVLQRV
jgi:SAM-dependent methyltransferase